MLKFLSFEKFKYLYRYAVKSSRIRITIVAIIIPSFFVILSAIAALFPDLLRWQKIYWTIFIYIFGFVIFFWFVYIKSTDELVAESKVNKEKALENHSYLQKLDAKFYGLSRTSYIVETEIKDDGSSFSINKTTLKATTDKVYSIEPQFKWCG